MKKYVVTGSIGHISKPIVEGLVKAGKEVSVITSSKDKTKEIESLGAKAIVGSVFDGEFVKKAFQGAEVVYAMIPPIWQTTDWRASQREVAHNYIAALKSNAIKYVVDLSSTGAHLGHGCGPVDGIAEFEKLLNNIDGLNVKHLRPSYFFYNFLNLIGMVKQANIMGGNFSGELALVHTKDIAKVALDELLKLNFTGNSVRYIFGDRRNVNDIVKVLGAAIGKQFPWVEFSDEQQKQGFLGAGLSETHADGYTAMGSALRSGKMQEEIFNFTPEPGAVKLEEFAKEFAKAYAAS